MSRILITGGSGFVGRAFRRAMPDTEILNVDLTEGIDARDFFRHDNTRFDLVIHLAAVVGGRAKIEGAPLDLAVDLSIDAEMFGWALRTRPLKTVYFSSSAAYPVWRQARDTHMRLTESDIRLDNIDTPDLTYGWAKLTGEMLARHAREQDLDVLVVRPFSGYGEDQALDYPFPSFIQRAVLREDPFTIWGDGTQVRDFIHIDDVVAAVIAAVNSGIEGPVNLGTGIGTSFNTLAEMVCDAAGYSPSFRHIETAPTGVHHRVADPGLMAEFFLPTISLDVGIKRALSAMTEEVA